MFETNANSRKTGINTIIKIDGKNRFVEFSQAFGIGKIKLAFREYDTTREKGNRLIRQIDCYLSTLEANYLANLCTTHAFREIGRDNERRRAECNYKYPAPIFENYSGTSKSNAIVSRRLTLSMKTSEELGDGKKNASPFTLMVNEGPGVRTETGAVIPDKNQSKSFQYIAIGLSTAQVIKIGCELERAIKIYDMWIANGTLEQKITEMQNISKAEAGSGQQYNRNNGHNAGNAGGQQYNRNNGHNAGNAGGQQYNRNNGYNAGNAGGQQQARPQKLPQQMQMQQPPSAGTVSGYVAGSGGQQTAQNSAGSINGYASRWQ